ncbi:MAG: AbrB/MazE/SpoVT family DNA-binding domain-containing protein [Thermoanaerobaculia bacterium]
MSVAAFSSFPADARFEIIAEAGGFLPFPAAVARRVGLKPGDFLALERWPASLRLEPYKAFFNAIRESLPPECLRNDVEQFLARPFTVLEARGLPIPRDLLPLQRGDEVILQVLSRGSYSEIYLYLARLPAALRRDLAIEEP